MTFARLPAQRAANPPSKAAARIALVKIIFRQSKHHRHSRLPLLPLLGAPNLVRLEEPFHYPLTDQEGIHLAVPASCSVLRVGMDLKAMVWHVPEGPSPRVALRRDRRCYSTCE
jgi:hypothetical protein